MSDRGYVLDDDLFSLTPEVQDRIPDKTEEADEQEKKPEEGEEADK